MLPSGSDVRDLLEKTFALLLLSAALGYGLHALRRDGVSFSAPRESAACGATDHGGVTVVTLPATEAVAELSLGALPLDARDAARFETGHVEGAVHLPCASSSREVEPVLLLAREAGAVVVYGDEGDVERLASELAARLGQGTRVVVSTGGFEALSSAGAAAESGTCERCGRSM